MPCSSSSDTSSESPYSSSIYSSSSSSSQSFTGPPPCCRSGLPCLSRHGPDLAFSLATAAARPPRTVLPRAPCPLSPLPATGACPRVLAGGFPAAASAARSRSSLCRAVPSRRLSITPDSAPPVGVQAHPPTSAPGPGAAPPPPQPFAPPHAPLAAGPTPVAPFAYSYPPRLDVAGSAPPGPRGLPFPVPAPHGPQRQHPLVPGSRLPAARFGFLCLAIPPSPAILRPLHSRTTSQCLASPMAAGAKTRCLAPLMTLRWIGMVSPPPSPPWGEPRPGDGAYQSRGMHLAEIGRCVTELSFVLDLLHDALQSREVVAQDPQMNEDQQGRVPRAVSSALWDVLHLPLEPADPLLDDGPGAAAFRTVAKAAEGCPHGIVPAIAYVLRWLGRRVKRM
ncbi:unnamed protein product [Closterium sp. NIES-65]|nr:unnamed protein product [Closterium sp. NIES-65]